MASFEIITVPTKPFAGQKPGTSGLRKKVAEVMQTNYLENFVQAIFDSLPEDYKGKTIVLGGDGRYYNDVAIQTIIKMAAANGCGKILVAKDGIFATPAVSATVRARKAYGAIILTASHNPGGPNDDFGIKYNISNGGPAPEDVTNAIYKATTTITQYKTSNLPQIDLSKIASHTFGSFTVEVIDAFSDYVPLLEKIFDFPAIKSLIARPNFKCLFDSLNGVTGPFSRRIFHEILGAPIESCVHSEPLNDFGGLHPDPNLTYASALVARVNSDEERIDFGCAWDGDGDRNMILGHKFFVTPSDSLAVIADYAALAIPHFKGGLKALSRSMPTSAAVDRVAKKLGLPLYEVPTGWKFFGNLMDKYEAEGSDGFICGEESFGTGSAHIREKDGIWATLAWLNILAYKNKDVAEGAPLVSVGDIVREHWKTYGRNYYCRYDYEGVDADAANKMIAHLRSVIQSTTPGTKMGNFELSKADDFEYRDPVDNSVSSKQGIRFVFSDGSRFVVRLSGTGSVGATIRLYLEQYEPTKIDLNAQEALKPLIRVALDTMNLKEFIGTETPTVIT